MKNNDSRQTSSPGTHERTEDDLARRREFSGEDIAREHASEPGRSESGEREEPAERSGVHPASAGTAPRNADVRAPGEWGKGAGGREGGRSEPSVRQTTEPKKTTD